MSNNEYSRLQVSDEPWCCKTCLREALPFFDTSSNSTFDILTPSSIFSSPPPSPNPILNSSPATNKHTNLLHSPGVRTTHPLRILSPNCRSLFPKIDNLRLLAKAHSPTSSHCVRPGLTIPFSIMNYSLRSIPLFVGIETDMVVALQSMCKTMSHVLSILSIPLLNL